MTPLVGVALLIVIVAPVDVPVREGASTDTCSCETARLKNQWCLACQVGYVAGLRIPSRLFHEALDAHGHDIDPASLECEECSAAYAKDGFCHRHSIGFKSKKAYTSRLTYHLALGEAKNVTVPDCTVCRKNSKSSGWCAKCRVGMVGNVVFTDQETATAAGREYDLLVAALKTLARCEFCAIAQFMSSRCPMCRIVYEDGKPKKPASSTGGKRR